MCLQQEKKKTPTKTSETKRTRRDRGEMEDIMFKLFERQPNWTLRQLIQETDQPEVCFLNNYSYLVLIGNFENFNAIPINQLILFSKLKRIWTNGSEDIVIKKKWC